MAYLDLILGVLLLYGFVKGIWNGFFAEAASLISLFAGIYIAIELSRYLKDFLEAHTSWGSGTILLLSFGLPFLATVVAIMLLVKAFLQC